MPEEFSIDINDFNEIYRAMADKANLNGDNTLSGEEISIFNEIRKTYNPKKNTFIFDQKFYNESGNTAEPFDNYKEPRVSTNIYKPEQEIEERKNNLAWQKVENYIKNLKQNSNKTIVVQKNINGKEVKFSYNRNSIENYIINEAVDSNGKKLTHFKDIPAIRKKAFFVRTKEEIYKLAEFNNMIQSAIDAGTEYGVDPKLIISIMQREVGFDGLNDKVTGINGKGYMQITTIPIKDMLGGYTKNNKLYYTDKNKTNIYGPEAEELLKSRGFDVNCPKDKKAELVNNIEKYLMENNDIDFNIRLGTLILRKYLNKYNGNIELTAQNYNGNSKNKIKYKYGKAVKSYYDQLRYNENTQKT